MLQMGFWVLLNIETAPSKDAFNVHFKIEAKRMSKCTTLAVFCFLSIFIPGVAVSDEPRIVRIEEDWQVEVTTPDPLQYSPQLSTWMSPHDSLDNEHFCANFNHAQKANSPGGGFQTSAFNGTATMDETVNRSGVMLSNNGESIKWTQVMAIINDELVFAIKNGTSQSWGDFGGPDTVVRFSSSIQNLNGYRPNRSVEWSGVGFASNRVALLKLAKVRYFTDQGQVFESSVNLVVQ